MRLLIAVIKECKKLIVFTLTDRIVFVRMTSCASNRQTKPNRPSCFRAIKTRLDAKLFLIGAPLRVGQCLTMKSGCQPLHVGGVGQ